MQSPDANHLLRTPAFLHSSAAVPLRPRRSHECSHGAARLADRDELLAANEQALQDPHATFLAGASPIVEVPGGRGAVEPLYCAGIALSEEARNAHVLAVGTTGTGKTTRVLLPLIANDIQDESRTVVVTDVKGNLLPFVSELMARHRPGRAPVVINLHDPERSVCWNPLQHRHPRSYRDVVHTLCRSAQLNRGDGDSPFWISTSEQLITAIAQTLAGDPRGVPSFARIREVVSSGPRKFGAWAAAHDHVGRLQAFVEFVASGSHNAQTVLADSLMRLAAFEDERVRSVTSSNGLDLAQFLVDEPGVLVVEMGEAHVSRLRPIWSVFFAELFNMLLDSAASTASGALRRGVSIHMDEFASAIGWLPDLPIRLNTLRSRRVSISASVQSLAQISNVYGREADSVVAGFRNKLFAPECDPVDAAYASRLSGTTTVEAASTSTVERIVDGEHRVETVRTSQTIGRPLLLPSEITHPPEHFAFGRPFTLFLADRMPFQSWLIPAYDSPELAPFVRYMRPSDAA
ncbi:MAG: type IV secretory system conjugative DNA transfer family protein [Planctomycetota bacterium]